MFSWYKKSLLVRNMKHIMDSIDRSTHPMNHTLIMTYIDTRGQKWMYIENVYWNIRVVMLEQFWGLFCVPLINTDSGL